MNPKPLDPAEGDVVDTGFLTTLSLDAGVLPRFHVQAATVSLSTCLCDVNHDSGKGSSSSNKSAGSIFDRWGNLPLIASTVSQDNVIQTH